MKTRPFSPTSSPVFPSGENIGHIVVVKITVDVTCWISVTVDNQVVRDKVVVIIREIYEDTASLLLINHYFSFQINKTS